MLKLGADLFPSYPQAGFKVNTNDQSSAVCLQPPPQSTRTPQHIKRYRKSYKEQHGITIKHYGIMNDPVPDENYPYGVPTEKSEGVGKIMKLGNKEGINAYLNKLQESKYSSEKRQPLACTINRKYTMPVQTKQKNFQYGLQTQKNQYDVKETIYSGVNMPEPAPIKQMYLKSHLEYDPGEQKKRPYNWKVDPDDFRFGKVAKNLIHNEIKQIIGPQSYNDHFPTTKLIKNNLKDYFDKKDDKLGKVSNLGQKKLPDNHAYGMKVEGNEWDAGKCLRGEANFYQVREDEDLGKCNKLNCTNVPKQGDESRVFGLPSIRYDIKKPNKMSLADPQNYADETTAIELLFPKKIEELGLTEEDFSKPRSRQEIDQILKRMGINLRPSIFQVIFERSKAFQGTILDKVSCLSMRRALQEMCG